MNTSKTYAAAVEAWAFGVLSLSRCQTVFALAPEDPANCRLKSV